jgi:hypothetical protein
MPKPIAVCIEDTTPHPGQPRYVACVAVVGRQAGLGLDGRGGILWHARAGLAAELWVSGDQQLILYRPEGAGPMSVHRGGRSLVVPCAKPVVMLDQDEVQFDHRRLRLHVHGVTAEVSPPRPLPAARGDSRSEVAGSGGLRAKAAALALGSLLAGACDKKIEVRDQPPLVPAPMPPPPSEPSRPDAAPAAPDAGAAAKPKAKKPASAKPKAAKPRRPPIEVRESPPFIMTVPKSPAGKPET